MVLDTGFYATGSGSIFIEAFSFSMTSRGLLSTNTGSLDIRTQSDMTLSQVRSLNGSIRLESLTSFIRRLEGLGLPTIYSVLTATILSPAQVDLIVDSDQVTLNDILYLREEGELYIILLV